MYETNGSNAVDLLAVQTALGINLKADDSLAAHLAGSETFSGAKTFSTTVTTNGLLVAAGGHYKERFALADDAVKIIAAPSTDKVSQITIVPATTPGAAVPSGMFWLRATGSPNSSAVAKHSTNTNVVTTTGILTGTTGADGNFTLSAHTDGNFYLENRAGFAVTLIVDIIGN